MITDKQIKAARIFAGVDQRELAKLADVSLPTIQRMEKHDISPSRSSVSNVEKVRSALESLGIRFIENGVQWVAEHAP